jgi:CRISPR-associated protein Csd2
MWEIDRSAARGLMCTRGLYVFEHDSKLGNAPAHELFELISINPLGADAAPRRFDDYKTSITVPPAGEVRPGVRLHRLVHWKGD